MYLILIVVSVVVFFYLVMVGGSLLEARGLVPHELAPFQELLEFVFNWLFDFWNYIAAYFS